MRWSAGAQTAGFGAISGTATWVVLAMMLGDWSTYTGPPVLQTLLVWIVANVVTVSVWAIHAGVTGSPRLWPHTLVPVFLLPVVSVGVLGGSQWRDAVETTAWWTAFAVAAHLLIALGAGLRWRGRVALAGVLVLLFAGVVTVQVTAQERWFTKALRERRLRPVVPVAAGYHADRVNLGRSTLVVRMSDGHGSSFVVSINRATVPCDGKPLCTADVIGYGYTGAVPAGTTLAPVPASVLAGIRRFTETAEAD
ncbi:hypothetical protein AB0K00_56630 [Dactylosporangium sp. NPDC049525]|uniref:hypothetical protein n=1 Tax=Dactylosporangium sp. NPDC049525 TaxID=3154730 RepID=UPI00343ECB73